MTDHKSLEAWKEAHAVTLGVTRASRDHWKPWASAMFSQINRASLSVQLNIAEGWSFGPSPTSTRHFSIAYGSAKETADLLDLIAEVGVLPDMEIEEIRSHSARCIRLLVGLLKKRRPRE